MTSCCHMMVSVLVWRLRHVESTEQDLFWGSSELQENFSLFKWREKGVGPKIPHFGTVQRNASMMYEVTRPSRGFALPTFIMHAVPHLQPHTHTHTSLHTWKVTVRNVGPSFRPLPFIKTPPCSWLCETVAAYETFLSRPHEFFKQPIALLHRNPWSLRRADGSEPRSSLSWREVSFLIGTWGVSLCYSLVKSKKN